ncbi:MAG: carboxyl transferase domain-containing protein [Acidimicrobiales bacterium]
MPIERLLIANRSEIAVRIARTAREAGIVTVMVHSADDDGAAHLRYADEIVALEGTGAAAYLDVAGLVTAATHAGCDALHPGYGFVSEHPGAAQACADAGIVFVGPTAATLDALGDKTAGRKLAERLGVPVIDGTDAGISDDGAVAFFRSLGDGASVMIKAASGGGGRGMRVVDSVDDLAAELDRCRSEAKAAFGDDTVFLERYLHPARHIEVQVVGDGTGAVVTLGERDCSLQRRNQKVVEIAPAPGLDPATRQGLADAAAALAAELDYRNLGTFEFLVGPAPASGPRPFAFIEANPRLQVEHTVTEEVFGLDLVRIQLDLAGGADLAGVGLGPGRIHQPEGFAIQARINTETMEPDGSPRPSGGLITGFELPNGPGIRVDTAQRAGSPTNPRYDSLLAKVIARHPSGSPEAVDRLSRALAELVVQGSATNASFLRAVLARPEVRDGRFDTRFITDHAAELVAAEPPDPGVADPGGAAADGAGDSGRAGARIDPADPLAVLDHGRAASARTGGAAAAPAPAVAEGLAPLLAPIQGTVVAVSVAPGDEVAVGRQMLVMEAMKMEHVIAAEVAGVVAEIRVSPGDTVFADHVLAVVTPGEVSAADDGEGEEVDLDHIRDDLAEVLERHRIGLDEARPDAVARRRRTNQRTARENLDDLLDPGTYIEYGALTIAAQRRRRSTEDLIARTPADGMLAGVGQVNGERFDAPDAQCVVMSYDYTVLAGTQGNQNHRKKDRLFEIAKDRLLPVVFFTEGGGGRPGDTDGLGVAGLDCLAFNYFGQLSGLVPMVGINSGRCFAGNAALLGCCDVIIATANSNIGMGGPAMIEGGGLGVFTPDEVGPMSVQVPNGVVDVAVADEAQAVAVAKQYLSYFQGDVAEWDCADQRLLRSVIPENRLRIYDVRSVIETLADTGSVLELRREFGIGMVTALARVEGRPVGIVANNPVHLAGAIDPDGADKAARFMKLCDGFGIPMVFLCDTPGIMVGPEIEKEALVRHAARLFVAGANLSVPICTFVLRKGYGLGAQAMAGGSFHAPMFTVGWPTSEFGGMGLEGAVKLGYRNELAAIEDPAERKATFDGMVDRMYRIGKGVNMASHFEIDDVIDPLETRRWIMTMLNTHTTGWRERRARGERAAVDTW